MQSPQTIRSLFELEKKACESLCCTGFYSAIAAFFSEAQESTKSRCRGQKAPLRACQSATQPDSIPGPTALMKGVTTEAVKLIDTPPAPFALRARPETISEFVEVVDSPPALADGVTSPESCIEPLIEPLNERSP